MKAHKDISQSRGMVGEVDTSAPFKSVKAAVSLFGQSVSSQEDLMRRKPKPRSPYSEKPYSSEAQLHLAQKELKKSKEKLVDCEQAKLQALDELEKAKQAVTDLTQKLKILQEPRVTATGETGTESNGFWKSELDNTKDQHAIAISELAVANQELRKARHVFEATMDAKVSAVEREKSEKLFADTYKEEAGQLSMEITTLQQSLMDLKLSTMQVKEEELKIVAEKDSMGQVYKLNLEEVQNKLACLKNEFHAQLVGVNLEAKLAETTNEIKLLHEELEEVKAAHLDSMATLTTKLSCMKEFLEKVVKEGSSLKNLVESLSLELQSTRTENLELKEKEAKAKSNMESLIASLEKNKIELETAISEETKARAVIEDLKSSLQQLLLESENARKDAEEIKKVAEKLMEEARTTQKLLDEREEELRVALKDAEEAKDAEAAASNWIKLCSEKIDRSKTSMSNSMANVIISAEEFESMNRRIKESQMMAEIKVADLEVQVEAVRANEAEATKKLEAILEERKEIASAIEEALKGSEIDLEAIKVLQGEMMRTYEGEQKIKGEAATLEFSEIATRVTLLPSARIPKVKLVKIEKVTKPTTTNGEAYLLKPNDVVHIEDTVVEGGSLSYVLEDKPGLLLLLD